MRRPAVALLATAALAAGATARADPGLPFHGTWACRQVVDGVVADGDWRETYGEQGLSVAGSGRPAERFAAAPAGPNAWRLTLADGATMALSLPAPWVLLRATLEHAYVCLRVAP